jgi:pimeloyl-ACP methyl ester carboxylesterase
MYTTSTAGTHLFYDEMGAGEPLVLLAGASQSHVLFIDNGLAEIFARSFRVILMDFTGLGKSDRVQDMKPSQWAEDVISVLDALGLPRVHLGGSSLGARVAARVAADSPGRVSTLLVDMPITSVDEEQEKQLNAFFSGYATNSLAPQAQRWHGEQWREAMDFFVGSSAGAVSGLLQPGVLPRGHRGADVDLPGRQRPSGASPFHGDGLAPRREGVLAVDRARRVQHVADAGVPRTGGQHLHPLRSRDGDHRMTVAGGRGVPGPAGQMPVGEGT